MKSSQTSSRRRISLCQRLACISLLLLLALSFPTAIAEDKPKIILVAPGVNSPLRYADAEEVILYPLVNLGERIFTEYEGNILEYKNGTLLVLAYQDSELRKGTRSIFVDGEKLLYYSGKGFFEVPLEGGELIPIYSHIAPLNPESDYDMVSDAEYIYALEKVNMLSTLHILRKSDGQIQSFPLGKDYDNLLAGDTIGEPFLITREQQDIDYYISKICRFSDGKPQEYLSFDPYPFVNQSEKFVYDKARHCFYTADTRYIYRLDENKQSIVALGLSPYSPAILQKDANTIYLESYNNIQEYTIEENLNNVLTIEGMGDLELLNAFNKADTGYFAVPHDRYSINPDLRSQAISDVLVAPLSEMKSLWASELVPLDLSISPKLQESLKTYHPFVQNALVEDGKHWAIPYNLYQYEADIEPYHFMVDRRVLEEMGIPEEELPHTYESFLAFLQKHKAALPAHYQWMRSGYDSSHLSLRLSVKFLNQYRRDCQAEGKALDLDFVKAQIQNIKELSQILVERDQEKLSLFRRMDDLIFYDAHFLPLPLGASEDSKHIFETQLDLLLIHANSTQQEGALRFLEFVSEHLPAKNKAKLLQDEEEASHYLGEYLYKLAQEQKGQDPVLALRRVLSSPNLAGTSAQKLLVKHYMGQLKMNAPELSTSLQKDYNEQFTRYLEFSDKIYAMDRLTLPSGYLGGAEEDATLQELETLVLDLLAQ